MYQSLVQVFIDQKQFVDPNSVCNTHVFSLCQVDFLYISIICQKTSQHLQLRFHNSDVSMANIHISTAHLQWLNSTLLYQL